MRLILTLLGLFSCSSAWAVACTITMADDLDFGTYDALDTSPLDSFSTISLECHETSLLLGGNYNQSYYVTLSQGMHGDYTLRKLSNGSAFLGYNLYIDFGRTTVWEVSILNRRNGSIYVPLCVSTILGCPQGTATETVYGRIFEEQSVPPDIYSDTITATIHF